MYTPKFLTDGNKAINVGWIISFVLAVLLVAWSIDNPQQKQTDLNSTVQFQITIYRHFTVYTDNIDGTIFVVEIDVDNTIPVSCDGYIEDDNGHNCVLVGSEDISSIISQYNLPYYNIKGE